MTNGDDAHVPGAGNYAEVNGLNMYYEIHGSGEPLILLHGGVGAIEMFGEVLPVLAEGRRVVAADLQAHGRTADIDRPLSYETMAEDVAALIGHLGLGKADVMGYSLGGGVALQTAIRHPEVVRKVVLVSTPFKRDGWYPEILAGMGQLGPEAAEPMKQTPMCQLYAGVAPRPEDWPAAHQVGSAARAGLRLVGRGGGDRGADDDRGRGRRQRPHRARRGVLRAIRRQGRRRVGWIRDVQRPARHPARHDALQHLLLPPPWHPPSRPSSTRPCRKPSKLLCIGRHVGQTKPSWLQPPMED